ncbi:hypothetical protein LCGC14_1267160, partial [marine sediment metagenome]
DSKGMRFETEVTSLVVKPNTQPKPVRPPKYNPRIHKAGDVVIKDNMIVTVPELDGEGNQVPGL